MRDALSKLDDSVFVSLWPLWYKRLLTTFFAYMHTMSTCEHLTDAARDRIEIIHEATLQDLLKNKNQAVWQLLEERNQALRER